MRTKYIWIILAALSFSFGGCAEEELPEAGGDREEKGLPVEFIMSCRSLEDAGKPASKVAQGQFEFEEGDVIHLSADFTLTGGDVRTLYDCLEYTGEEWVSKDSGTGQASPMMWPWDAESATFYAYYLAHSSGILVSRIERSLDMLMEEADPLYACAADVSYGAAVGLEFGHLCTRLTVTGLSEGETEFWLMKDQMTDAFALERNEDASLVFGFYAADASGRPGGVNHVAGKSSGDGTAEFYLAPGDYSDIVIDYAFGIPYLRLTDIVGLADLEAGKSYTLQINPGSGNVDVSDEEDKWPDPDDNTDDVKLSSEEIDALLEAVHDGEEYVTPAGIPILASISGGTALLRNLDFQSQGFTPRELPNGAVFDGKYHYIKNVYGSGIFSAVNGRVSNLGIAGGTIDAGENVENTGILAAESSVSAVLNNIRLKDISISAVPPETEAVANIGALVGNNSGAVINIEAGGKIFVTVISDHSYSRVNVGGLFGQSSGNITNAGMMNDDDGADIIVRCDCRFPETSDNDYAEGERYVGGVVGLSTASISDCSIRAEVDASDSRGVLMYTGGLAGMLRGSGDASSGVSLSNSVASCQVTGGLAFPIDETVNGEGRSYTGGLVGYAYAVSSVSDCVSLGTVYGHDYYDGFAPYGNVYYALGGAFGQLYLAGSVSGTDVRSEISTDLVFGEDDLYFIGSFVGRSDKDWSDGNSVHSSGNYDFTGETGNIEY